MYPPPNPKPRKQPRLFFDIETQSNPETCALMPEPVIEAPANYKDPEKIAQYIAEKTEAAKTAALDKAALDPDYGRILSIGLSTGEEVLVFLNRDIYFPKPEDPEAKWEFPANALSEAGLLMTFWKTFSRCHGCCVGFNILGFDLPYLLRRSMALGVKPPFIPNMAKFRTEPVTDLMAILYNWGSDRYKGLKQVARIYGIPNECPDVDGSKVAGLDWLTLSAYQESDVRLTIALYNRMNGVYFNH